MIAVESLVAAYLANRAALLAGQTDLSPSTQAGVTSGQGNQGTANTATLLGHAGTGADAGSVPRTLQF